MNAVYNKLLAYKNNPQVSNKEHVQSIKQMEENIENNICPRCGKPLIKKESKYGAFYGCSGYPKCKFNKKL